MPHYNRVPSIREKVLSGVLLTFLGAQALVGCASATPNKAPTGVTGPQILAAENRLHAAIVAGRPVTYESGILGCNGPLNKRPTNIESPLVTNTDNGQQLVGYVEVDHTAPNGFDIVLFSPTDPGIPEFAPGQEKPCVLVRDGADPANAPGTMHSAVLHTEGVVDGGNVTGTDPTTGAVIDRSADNRPLPIGEWFESNK